MTECCYCHHVDDALHLPVRSSRTIGMGSIETVTHCNVVCPKCDEKYQTIPNGAAHACAKVVARG